jgi:hypothetical protein
MFSSHFQIKLTNSKQKDLIVICWTQEQNSEYLSNLKIVSGGKKRPKYPPPQKSNCFKNKTSNYKMNRKLFK